MASPIISQRVTKTVQDALNCGTSIECCFDFRRTTILGELSTAAFEWEEESRQENLSAPGNQTEHGNDAGMGRCFPRENYPLKLHVLHQKRTDFIGRLISGPVAETAIVLCTWTA